MDGEWEYIHPVSNENIVTMIKKHIYFNVSVSFCYEIGTSDLIINQYRDKCDYELKILIEKERKKILGEK